MPKTYDRVMAQLQKLQRQADRLKKQRSEAIGRVNSLIREFGIIAGELVLSTSSAKRTVKRRSKSAAKSVKRRAKKVLPKYRGPGGVTWSGRGLMPVWLREAVKKGKKKEDFLIAKAK